MSVSSPVKKTQQTSRVPLHANLRTQQVRGDGTPFCRILRAKHGHYSIIIVVPSNNRHNASVKSKRYLVF